MSGRKIGVFPLICIFKWVHSGDVRDKLDQRRGVQIQEDRIDMLSFADDNGGFDGIFGGNRRHSCILMQYENQQG